MLKELKHSLGHIELLISRPLVIPKVFAGYFKTLILRQAVLRVVEFVVNHECQSNCVMCCASKNRKDDQVPLSPAEIKNVWNQSAKLGAVVAILEGGEATLRKDFLEIIQALDPKRTIIHLITNSLGLNKGRLLDMKKAGLVSICFSLDGPDAETNDKIRGSKGHFNQVVQCIKWAKEVGLIVCIAPTLSHGQIQKVKKIIQMALELGCNITPATAVLSGRWAKQSEYLLDNVEWEEIRQLLNTYPQMRFDWSINYSLKSECPGGREKISVGVYGDILGCPGNPISFGNVREEPLKKIWKRMHNFIPFKKRSPICLISEDVNYIKSFIDPIAELQQHPVSINSHPNQSIINTAFNS